MAYLNVEVEVYEIVSALSDDEKQEMANQLYGDDILPNGFHTYSGNDELDIAVLKLYGKAIQLTADQVKTIVDLSKKVI